MPTKIYIPKAADRFSPVEAFSQVPETGSAKLLWKLRQEFSVNAWLHGVGIRTFVGLACCRGERFLRESVSLLVCLSACLLECACWEAMAPLASLCRITLPISHSRELHVFVYTEQMIPPTGTCCSVRMVIGNQHQNIVIDETVLRGKGSEKYPVPIKPLPFQPSSAASYFPFSSKFDDLQCL